MSQWGRVVFLFAWAGLSAGQSFTNVAHARDRDGEIGAAIGGAILGGLISGAINNNNNNNNNQGFDDGFDDGGFDDGDGMYYPDQPQQPQTPVGTVMNFTDGTQRQWNGFQWVILTQPGAAPGTGGGADKPEKKERPSAPERPQVSPLSNSLKRKTRAATASDLKRVQSELKKQMDTVLTDLEGELEDSLIDPTVLAAELQSMEVSVEDQDRILQAVDRGKSAEVQSAMLAVTQDLNKATDLSRRVALTSMMTDLRDLADSGEMDTAEVKSFTRTVKKMDLDSGTTRSVTKAVQQLGSLAEIAELTKKSRGGKAESILLSEVSGQVITAPMLESGAILSVGGGVYLVGGGTELALSEGGLADVLELPTFSEPAVEPGAELRPVKGGIVLINPEDSGAPAYYEWDGEERKLAPGEHIRHYTKESEVIRFNRGGKFGWANIECKPATYVFKAGTKGWKLAQRKFAVTIDNTRNAQPFNLVWQDIKKVIPANESLELTSDWPAYLKFDRGNKDFKKVDFWSAGKPVYVVGLSAEDSLWDLFDESAIGATDE